jgi:hypothetical protein
MKQYTTPEQTAKLIELGFMEPHEEDMEISDAHGIVCFPAYNIGDLVEMLPKKVTDKHGHDAILQMTCFNGEWRVKYAGAYDLGLMIARELVDALYYMIIQLKEEGVI